MAVAEKEEVASDVVLDDGSMAHIRRALETDLTFFEAFVAALSDRSLSQLFLKTVDRKEALRRLSPGPGRFVLVAERDRRIIGHAAFQRTDSEAAKMELLVLDSFQGRGLGTILLGELAEAARGEGVATLEVLMSPDNHMMIKVLHDLGFPTSVSIRARCGESHVPYLNRGRDGRGV